MIFLYIQTCISVTLSQILCCFLISSIFFNNYAPVIWNPGPYGAADSGDIAGLKCRDLTSDESRQCRGFNFPLKYPGEIAGVLAGFYRDIVQCIRRDLTSR